MTETLLGIAGAFLLYVFFRAVEARWPESYYGVSDFTSYQLSLRLGSYLAFRFLPVLVVAFVASAFATSHGASGVISSLAVAAIHGLATVGRAALNALLHREVFGRRLLLAAHVGIFVSVLIAGWLGGILGGVEELHVLIPDAEDMRSDLWTALLAGIAGAYLVRVSRQSEVDPAELIMASTRRIDPSLLALAETLAGEHQADANLVRALLLVENLQRPGWIRSIERIAGGLLPVGTYGVMQVRSDSPISDAESIERAVSTRLAGMRVPRTPKGNVDYETLRRLISTYNGNQRFVELVELVYYELESA